MLSANCTCVIAPQVDSAVESTRFLNTVRTINPDAAAVIMIETANAVRPDVLSAIVATGPDVIHLGNMFLKITSVAVVISVLQLSRVVP